MNDSTRFLTDLMKIIESICEENGIEYLAQFQMNKGTGLIYHYQSNNDMLLTGDTILSQYQKFYARNSK